MVIPLTEQIMPINSYSSLDAYEAAHEYVELGYHLVPIEVGTKVPLVPWKESECSHRLIDHWFDRFRFAINLAIHARKSGVIVLDADTEPAARWIARECPDTPMFATTPRGGIHAYFRDPGNVRSTQKLHGIKGLEVKTNLLLASPSWSREHDRKWLWKGDVVPPSELPEIPASLISNQPRPRPKTPDRLTVGRACGHIRDVTRWIMSVPSVQGSNGSSGCFKVACRLVDAGSSWEEAMNWLRAWNERVPEPPWSEEELQHKLRSAFNR
jgi:hypothetical protein